MPLELQDAAYQKHPRKANLMNHLTKESPDFSLPLRLGKRTRRVAQPVCDFLIARVGEQTFIPGLLVATLGRQSNLPSPLIGQGEPSGGLNCTVIGSCVVMACRS